MKIYAKQTPPEYTDSPLNRHDDIEENIFIFGNDRFMSHTSEFFDSIPRMLETIADELEYLQRGKSSYNSFIEILNDYAPPRGRDEYTRSERKREWIDIIKRWTETDEENTVFCDVLELVTRQAFNCSTIRGSVQGEWQYIIYPREYSREWLRAFEAEYFNTGTEWSIKEGDGGDEYFVYCTTYDPRAEIAQITNTTPENVILYEFDGWEKTPKYKEARA
jgi:hypothetical protein